MYYVMSLKRLFILYINILSHVGHCELTFLIALIFIYLSLSNLGNFSLSHVVIVAFSVFFSSVLFPRDSTSKKCIIYHLKYNLQSTLKCWSIWVPISISNQFFTDFFIFATETLKTFLKRFRWIIRFDYLPV